MSNPLSMHAAVRSMLTLWLAAGATGGCGLLRSGDGNEATVGSATATPTATATPPAPVARTFTALAVGERHACARADSGALSCWGSNASGQLGAPGVERALTPRPVVGLPPVTAVAVGGDHTCAAGVDGKLYCWGSTFRSSTKTPTVMEGVPAPVSVALSSSHACAAVASGKVLCWGSNYQGELGDGTTTHREQPVEVKGITDAVEVVAGSHASCARRETGAIACWGSNASGQLGSGAKEREHHEPVAVIGLADATRLSAGSHHVCALRATGVLSCWGRNFAGSLGTDGSEDHAVPVAVDGVAGAIDVAAGNNHSCAARDDGAVWCWGARTDGQLGRGEPIEGLGFEATEPGPVQDVAGATRVATAAHTTCAIVDGGAAVKCWGSGAHGRLGNGWAERHPAPVEVVGIDDAVAVAVSWDFSCALRRSGAVACWGDGSAPKLWGGERERERPYPPADIGEVAGARRLLTAHRRVAAIGESGNMWLWAGGLPTHAIDPADPEWSPRKVEGLGEVRSLAAMEHALFVVQGDGQLAAAYLRDKGEAAAMVHGAHLRPVAGLRDAEQVAVAGKTVCVRRTTGQVTCFEHQHVYLRRDKTPPRQPIEPKRIDVAHVDRAEDLSLRGAVGCSVVGGGRVACWGDAPRREERFVASVVDGVHDAVQVGVGGTFGQVRCALVRSGRVLCWGRTRSDEGLYGRGSFEPQPEPQEVPGIDDAEALAIGDEHACVQRKSGKVACWGRNDADQVGAATPGRSSRPVGVAF